MCVCGCVCAFGKREREIIVTRNSLRKHTAVLKVVIIESTSVSSLLMMVRGANLPPIIAWKVSCSATDRERERERESVSVWRQFSTDGSPLAL